MSKYIYPKLPARYSSPFFRIGGNGLANCLFVYAKAIVWAKKYNKKIIAPTWFNISIGPYLRKEKDKRHYLGLFTGKNEVSGLTKVVKLLFNRKSRNVECIDIENSDVFICEGIYEFFAPLLGYHKLIKDYLLDHLQSSLLYSVNNYDFENVVGVHIRLGDFPEDRRVPIEWYKKRILQLKGFRKVILFSDGTNVELQDLLKLDDVERVFFGGAIQDIIALSKCSYIIGSDSSFSAWGAFLGQVPCVFHKLQFGYILSNKSKQIIENKAKEEE